MRRSDATVILVVLDGWGTAPNRRWNAISRAAIPNLRAIQHEFGSVQLCASGNCVGLVKGQIGNSEVGHLTMRSGRVVPSDLVTINELIKSHKLCRNKDLNNLLRSANRHGSAVHLLGLVSDGGVHSHINHLFSLLEIAAEKGTTKLYVHVILDGRDTAPLSGINYVKSLLKQMDSVGVGKIATVSGRYYAMDRDNRWARTKLAYEAIAYGKGQRFNEAIESIKQSYEVGKTDEFVRPRIIGDYRGLEDSDALIFFNFRPDRARQLTSALLFPRKVFRGISKTKRQDDIHVERKKKIDLLTMTEYHPRFKRVTSILRPQQVRDTLGDALEKNHVEQLRLAETEKYAHVTYFFNGLREKPSKHEKRILVPSRRNAETYDKIPDMSAKSITEKAVRGIESSQYRFVLVNYANADMVGHTGNLNATISAVETLDGCIGQLFKVWKEKTDRDNRTELTILITGDHGKAEEMVDKSTGRPRTAHTSNSVPFLAVSKKWRVISKCHQNAGLSDVAPSVLKILGIRKPKLMTGKPIIELIR